MNNTKRMTHWTTALALGLVLAGAAVAQDEDAPNPTRHIAAGTQVKVKLLQSLSSEDANVGDTVRAQVAGDNSSGLPTGTVFYGRVTSVHPATTKRPGIVYVRFGTRPLSDQSALTPDVATAHLVGSSAHSEKAGDISIGAGIGGLIGLSASANWATPPPARPSAPSAATPPTRRRRSPPPMSSEEGCQEIPSASTTP